ncbi:Asp23/Gls24 family envelope stress response protein [Geodermatophilus sp. FMUSA9-8]|uniref:Asp23/Gls24 family envelope stress response protein n=1 Tax=Geodermatophilus sp. FMUSA9-8 TaxID=3120155 RepID=UPI00300A21D1
MSAPAPPGDRPGAALPDAAARGRLTVADRAVERIAAQAAAEVDRATGAPRRVLGLAVGGADDRPQVSARVDWPVATVAVTMSVSWPAPVLQVTEQVRRHVEERLATLAGVRTAGVDVRVTALTGAADRDRRVS